VTCPASRSRLVGSLLLIALLLGPSLPAHGQESPRFGLALGLNLATLDTPGADANVRALFSGGGVAHLGLVGPLSVQGELLFDQKGAAVEENGDVIRYGAGYVDLPLLLRVDGPELGAVTLYGLAGGFGGVKVFEQQRAGGDLSLPLPDPGTSFFTRTNAGLTGGIGGVLSIGGGRGLNLVVRYSHGLVDVARAPDEPPFSVPFPAEARTRTVSIMLHLGL
jgi:hypothetical protein